MIVFAECVTEGVYMEGIPVDSEIRGEYRKEYPESMEINGMEP